MPVDLDHIDHVILLDASTFLCSAAEIPTAISGLFKHTPVRSLLPYEASWHDVFHLGRDRVAEVLKQLYGSNLNCLSPTIARGRLARETSSNSQSKMDLTPVTTATS
jgi:hypothetical protein